MRTTLTLDDDVAVMLERLSRERDASFKTIVNDVIRAGLIASTRREAPKRRYVTRPVSLGKPRLPSLDNIAEVLAIAEGEHRS